MASIEQPPPLDIRSVWVRRPQPYRLRQTYPELAGISVDACPQTDSETTEWVIRSGDWTLTKKGLWVNEPRSPRLIAEFHASTRWDDFDAALAFAQVYVAKEEATPHVEL